MRRLPLFVVVMMVGTSARAEGRLWLTGGGSYRDHQQFDRLGLATVRVGGTAQSIAPWNLHFSGAYFFNSFVGVDLETRGELFFATQGPNAVPQPALEFTPAAALRWGPVRWLSLEGQLGWALHLRAGITSGPKEQDTWFTGPSFGVAVGLTPSRFFSAQLFFRAQPVSFALGRVPGFQALALAGGAQLSVGALRLGAVQLGGAVTLELSSARLASAEGSGTQLGARVGVGLSLSRAVEEADDPARVEASVRVTLAGQAVSPEGGALPGVVVTLDGEGPTRSDEGGAFTFAEVTTGPHVLRARKDGFKPGLLEVAVTSSPAPVVLTLAAPTGPGRVTGVVRSAGSPVSGGAVSSGAVSGAAVSSGAVSGAAVSGAAVSVGELQVLTDGAGRFALEGVGPGPVKVAVKAADFADAEEVAQVPAEGEASLDFTLVPRATEVRATLRGLIRAKSGEPVKATVRVVELKLKVAVKADGRFSADVPSGRYTVVIEARGYLTQTKTVEVSGGDQAIFHAELERTR